MAGKIVIVGGGVIGLCTAYYASSDGADVTLLERRDMEHYGCSFGNAGMITPSHFVPLSAPGVIGRALRWMGNPESPFYLRPRLDAQLAGWAWKFHRASRAERVALAAPLILSLNLASLDGFAELAAERNDFGLVRNGLLMLCNSTHGLEEELRTAEYGGKLGLFSELVTSREIEELEPGITLRVAGGILYPKDARLSPMKLMATLLDRVRERGVDVNFNTEVSGWQKSGNSIVSVTAGGRSWGGDEFVICGGAWSPALVKSLGLSLPMQAGKGYSLTLSSPPQVPSRGLILSEASVAITPLNGSLRIGGTMEIAGLEESIRPARVRGIIKSALRYLPKFRKEDFVGVEPWCGLRPCSPDGLPYIGRFGRYSNLSVAAGHAMMGVSLGPITGKLMSDVLSMREPSISIELLSPDRYARAV